jgi:hypothetical protein
MSMLYSDLISDVLLKAQNGNWPSNTGNPNGLDEGEGSGSGATGGSGIYDIDWTFPDYSSDRNNPLRFYCVAMKIVSNANDTLPGFYTALAAAKKAFANDSYILSRLNTLSSLEFLQGVIDKYGRLSDLYLNFLFEVVWDAEGEGDE